MSAVMKQHPVQELQPVEQEAANLLSVISRAASNPEVDVTKMERLMAMYERVESRRSEAEFASALADMSPELPSIGERGSAAGRYTYALWEDINAAIKPILQRHGFALSFRTECVDGIAVTGVLSHRSGHREQTTIKLPADSSGNKNAVQAVASSVSYGKRYTAGALLNLTSHGEDDDAFAAAGEPAYDVTDWAASIESAATKDDLDAIARELKATKVIPEKALKTIRALYAKRTKAIADGAN